MVKPEDITILVVDDEPDVLTFLAMALEDAGFKVMTASNGEEALDMAVRNKPDFISLDLVMPRKSGIRFLHELRRRKDWSSIPVMIVTAHARDDLGSKDLSEVLEGKILSGPEAYLEKPVKALDFVNIVKKKLGIEIPDEGVPWPATMRDTARDMLSKADPDTIRKVLDVLRKKETD